MFAFERMIEGIARVLRPAES